MQKESPKIRTQVGISISDDGNHLLFTLLLSEDRWS